MIARFLRSSQMEFPRQLRTGLEDCQQQVSANLNVQLGAGCQPPLKDQSRSKVGNWQRFKSRGSHILDVQVWDQRFLNLYFLDFLHVFSGC